MTTKERANNPFRVGQTLIAKADQYEGREKWLTKDKHYSIIELSRVATYITNDRGNNCAFYHFEVDNFFFY